MKVKRPNRAERLHALLKTGWHTSWAICQSVGTVKPTNCTSELRRSGVRVEQRRNAAGLYEYRVSA